MATTTSAEPLTHAESAALAMAMIEAGSRGDPHLVIAVTKLADDPARLREVMASAKAGNKSEREKAFDESKVKRDAGRFASQAGAAAAADAGKNPGRQPAAAPLVELAGRLGTPDGAKQSKAFADQHIDRLSGSLAKFLSDVAPMADEVHGHAGPVLMALRGSTGSMPSFAARKVEQAFSDIATSHDAEKTKSIVGRLASWIGGLPKKAAVAVAKGLYRFGTTMMRHAKLALKGYATSMGRTSLGVGVHLAGIALGVGLMISVPFIPMGAIAASSSTPAIANLFLHAITLFPAAAIAKRIINATTDQAGKIMYREKAAVDSEARADDGKWTSGGGGGGGGGGEGKPSAAATKAAPAENDLAGAVTEKRLHPGVSIDRTPDGSRWVVKDRGGRGHAAANEAAAASLAKIAGIDVPAVHHVKVKGVDVAAVELIHGANDLSNMGDDERRAALAKVPRQEIDRHTLFDYLIGASDSNNGNFMIKGDGGLVAIDKEQSLNHGKIGNKAEFRVPFMLSDLVEKGASPSAYQFDSAAVSHMADAGQKMAAHLDATGRSKDAEGVRRRAEVLHQLAHGSAPVTAGSIDEAGRAKDKSAPPPAGLGRWVRGLFGG